MSARPAAVQWFRIATAACAWGGLVAQYVLIMNAPFPVGPAWRTVFFCAYFTVLTNAMAALAMTLPVIAPRSQLSQFFDRPGVRTAILSYLTVTAATFFLLIRHDFFAVARSDAVDATLHYLVPALFLADWLLFVPKGMLNAAAVIRWAIVPAVYGVYLVLLGLTLEVYPYAFVNARTLGYWRLTGVIAAFGVAFVVTGLALVGLDRALGRPGGRPA